MEGSLECLGLLHPLPSAICKPLNLWGPQHLFHQRWISDFSCDGVHTPRACAAGSALTHTGSRVFVAHLLATFGSTSGFPLVGISSLLLRL